MYRDQRIQAEVTVLDCSNPMVFIKASDLGIKGSDDMN